MQSMRSVRVPERRHAVFLHTWRALFHACCCCPVLLSDADPSSAPLLASQSVTCPTIRAVMQVFILSYHTGSLGMSTFFPRKIPAKTVELLMRKIEHVEATVKT